MPLKLLQCLAVPEPGSGMLGPQAQKPREGGQRILEALQVAQRHTAVKPGIRVVGLHRQRLVQSAQRRFWTAQLDQRGGKVGKGGNAARQQ